MIGTVIEIQLEMALMDFIPTYMPPPGYGEEIALRHALGIDNYDMYRAHTSSVIAVDLGNH